MRIHRTRLLEDVSVLLGTLLLFLYHFLYYYFLLLTPDTDIISVLICYGIAASPWASPKASLKPFI